MENTSLNDNTTIKGFGDHIPAFILIKRAS
jgi:hypothetical protein